ncbi:biopolymer transporter ExbD [Simkania negevensis]|uniref:Biopolymer transporter ExbD n=1 Tax=Simkania negevensis TaxID=83561 RepID=A0ABS3ASQ8_9BACT|nr:biopolymer transporter ExbD [Simkania negevensis]
MKFNTSLKFSKSLIDLTPLVDVIFLLLIFFVITSDILPLKSLNVDNPHINKDSAPITTQIIVTMDAHNVVYLGKKKEIVDLHSLKEDLLNEIERVQKNEPGARPSIVLSVDKRVAYGPFLRLFSLTQECGHRVRLAYRPGEEEEVVSFVETVPSRL